MNFKRYRTPTLLLLVLLGLGGLAYWDETKTSADKTALEGQSRLYDFQVEKIVEVTVSNPAVQPSLWVLKKEDSQWRVTTPLQYPADGEGVERFLKILAEAKYERQFAITDKSLSAYGLDKPQLQYTMKDQAGKVWTFTMGGKSPVGYSSYVKTDDPKNVYLANQYLLTASSKSLDDFRDRSLFLPKPDEVQALEVTWADLPALRIARQEKDWQLEKPVVAKADPGEVNNLLTGWTGLRVLDFIDSPPPDLRKALTETGAGTKEYVRVRLSGKTPNELLLLENNGKLYAKVSEVSFAEVDKAKVDALKKSVNDLLDRTLFTFATSDITELRIDGTAYRREKDSWVEGEGANQKAAPFVQSILVSLEFAKADLKLVPAEGQSLSQGPALHTVALHKGDSVVAQFSLWKKPGDGKLVMKNGENYFVVNGEFLDILKPKQDGSPLTLGGDIKSEGP